jgi:hypothetical protein
VAGCTIAVVDLRRRLALIDIDLGMCRRRSQGGKQSYRRRKTPAHRDLLKPPAEGELSLPQNQRFASRTCPPLAWAGKLSLLVKDDFVLMTASSQIRWRKISTGGGKRLQV